MHIVFAASECIPYVKTGGLADVIGALPKEIAALGHRVTVYLPYYRQVREKAPEKKPVIRSITIPFEYYNRFVTILDGGLHEGVQICFVDCPELFDRESLYATPTGDYLDNWERFGLFGRAVLEATKQLGVPDIFHVHDWQAAMIPVYLRTTYYFDPALRNAGCVLTIHNAGYQGWFPPQTIERLLLPWDIFTMDKVEQYDTFNYLKGGIVYSDAITTVSRRYAEEITTPEFGNGLDSVLRSRGADLHGILNGVDYTLWNPETDHNIAAHYTPKKLAGKLECRRDLLHAFGASQVADETPVLGIVSRFATQKGFDLIAQIANRLLNEDVFLVALGTGEPYYEGLFRSLHEQYSGRISVRIGYDDALAHKVEAGSDIFLMPSRYEPCGLNQIYSLKYGTVPVVHATGGLDDTVEEWNGEEKTGTGFKFHDQNADSFLAAIHRAADLFRDDKNAWTTLMRNGMGKDFSWKEPARQYAALYEEVARRRS
ncbi:glycogen synthase GlgA [Silvibacterium acidisoli]|uniref:glycogen synthase GlgA n=1 Tax=Acidobacteriaceae bacterium ZG23-2 TaxID=2883246 RepID=UPI00406C5053